MTSNTRTEQRKYSVAELDRMRQAIRLLIVGPWPHVVRALPMGMCDPVDIETEDRLRTYMLNGTEPEELEQAAAALMKAKAGAPDG
jgi:hypothetical protein